MKLLLAAVCIGPSLVAQCPPGSKGPFAGTNASFSFQSEFGVGLPGVFSKDVGFKSSPPVDESSATGPNFALLQIESQSPLGFVDIDAFSIGHDWITADEFGAAKLELPRAWQAVHFSVSSMSTGDDSAGAQGVIQREVDCASTNGAKSDLFSYTVPGSTGMHPSFIDRVHRALDASESGVGAIPNVDAYDYFIRTYNEKPTQPVDLRPPLNQPLSDNPTFYFSVTATSLQYTNPFWWGGMCPSGATILQTTWNGSSWSTPSVFLSYADLGLDECDDIDALSIDRDREGANHHMLYSKTLATTGSGESQVMFVDLESSLPHTAVSYGIRQSPGGPIIPIVNRLDIDLSTDDVDAMCNLDPGERIARPQTPAGSGVESSAFRYYDEGLGMVCVQTHVIGYPPNGLLATGSGLTRTTGSESVSLGGGCQTSGPFDFDPITLIEYLPNACTPDASHTDYQWTIGNGSGQLSGPLMRFLTEECCECFDGELGASVVAGDDTITTITTSSGFVLGWPDGSASTDFDIDSNGRLVPVGSSGSDFTESVAEHISTVQIAPYWEDWAPQIGGGIYVYEDPAGEYVNVTWLQVPPFGGGGAMTFAIQVFTVAGQPPGTKSDFVLSYAPATAVDDGIVGVSDGSGVGASTDLSPGAGPATQLFEDFGTFDIFDSALCFEDAGVAGYTCSPAVPCGPFPYGAASSGGRSCTNCPPNALTFIPGGGGYTVLNGTGTFDPNVATFGTDLQMADDSIVTFDLDGWSFPMPDGALVGMVDVDSNGRILAVGADTSDFTPSVPEFLSQVGGMLACWNDWAPNNGGKVLAYTDCAGYAVVEWQDVPQFPAIGMNTFQIQMFASGTFVIAFRDNTIDDAAHDFLVGASDGTGIDPGEVDLTGFPAGIGSTYEFFDTVLLEMQDLQVCPVRLLASPATAAIIASTYSVTFTNLPASTAAVFALVELDGPVLGSNGFPMQPLFPDLYGCVLYASPSIPAVNITSSLVGSTAQFDVFVTPPPGLRIRVQGALLTVPPVNTLGGLLLTNYVDAIVSF